MVTKEGSSTYVDMKIEDGIFYMTYKPLEVLSYEIAQEIVKERIAFKAGQSYPCLFDIREVKSTSKEARDYLADEGNELVISSALLVNSSVTKMIGNFFITVSRPKSPTRLFVREDKSREWLDQHNTELA